jgi:hypothetical protein
MHMKAIARKLSCPTCSEPEANSHGLGNVEAQAQCTCANYSEVIETSADQPWADFCETLDQPAFLMPVTGFGDLE